MRSIEQTYTIKAPIEKVWLALTDANTAEKWGAGPAKVDAEVGGEFSYWDGDIHGKFTKIEPNKLIEQDWYGHDHPDHKYKVTFEIKGDEEKTTVHFLHEDIPDSDEDDWEAGWKDYYFDPIKELLEK
ncbi:MAG TPA: SRPBCC domain-containing protein [Candidatus Saccharimonadales bacterium]|nr:SRPBCC domain-containing protein [Candidatus Saccharimonadales bacterium]